MNNPLALLQTLDSHLDHPVELTLYGRTALALGFAPHEFRHETTQDVDAITPLAQLDQPHSDEQFWETRDTTNAERAERSLCMTHLFTEADVFLLGTRCIVACRLWRVLTDEGACDLPWSLYPPFNLHRDLPAQVAGSR